MFFTIKSQDQYFWEMGSRGGVNVAVKDEDQVPREGDSKEQQKCMPWERLDTGPMNHGSENREVGQT